MSNIMELVDRHRDTKLGYGVAKLRAAIEDEIKQLEAERDALKAEIEKLKFDGSVTVLHRDEITKTCNALKAKVLELERDNASHLNNLRTASNTILGYRSGLVTDLMASAVAGAMDMYIDAARSKT